MRAAARRRHGLSCWRETARMRVSVQVEQLEDVKSSEPNPESQAMASQSGRSVMLALATVPAEQRMVLELAYFAGLSHSEIAERLGQPLGR